MTDTPSNIGMRKNPGRHNIGMSAHAATAYLELKLQLLEMEVPWDLSDSALIEFLCAKAKDANLNPWTFRPKTKDARRPSRLPRQEPRSPGEAKLVSDRIIDTILKRKEKTIERLEHFRAYPAAAIERKREAARKQFREKGHPLRRRNGGLPDPGSP